MSDPISPRDFGASFKGFMEQMAQQTPREEPFFPRRLRDHFGADPSKLTIVGEKLALADHPNLHLALEAFVSAAGRTFELIGITTAAPPFMGLKLTDLIAPGGMMQAGAASEGPVSYTRIPLDGDRVLACTELGIYLVREGDARLAILVQRPHERAAGTVTVEVLAADRGAAEACLAALRTAMR
jgi:hypothetical protein